MLTDRLITLFERNPRGYVGRHRAPRYMRYVAAAQVRPSRAAESATET